MSYGGEKFVMSMSASILREIVARTFNVKATNVILSGEISPSEKWQNSFFNGSMGKDENNFRIWGFNPKEGFIEISHIVGKKSGSNYAHSSSIDEDGQELHTVENIGDHVFFVVNNEGFDHWEGSRQEDWNTWTLYKAPNFKEHWEKIKQEDIARWEQWIAN